MPKTRPADANLEEPRDDIEQDTEESSSLASNLVFAEGKISPEKKQVLLAKLAQKKREYAQKREGEEVTMRRLHAVAAKTGNEALAKVIAAIPAEKLPELKVANDKPLPHPEEMPPLPQTLIFENKKGDLIFRENLDENPTVRTWEVEQNGTLQGHFGSLELDLAIDAAFQTPAHLEDIISFHRDFAEWMIEIDPNQATTHLTWAEELETSLLPTQKTPQQIQEEEPQMV
jgi:hypothetical protein